MADRRQGDRRENSGFQNKKVSISMSSLISAGIIVLLIIVAIISSKISYSKGYDNGFSDGFSELLIDSDYINETYEEDNLDLTDDDDIVE